jgi:hypothetical protein
MLLVGGLAVLAAAGLAFAQTPVLVNGQPPLTEELVGRYTEFFEWAFDVHLTGDQRQVLRNYAVDAWTKRKKSDMDDVVGVVQQQIDLAKLPAEQRRYVRVKIEPELLDQMRKQPNEPMARWALAVYESSHKILAPGTPPLTRQSTDAYLESLFFMTGEVSGQPSVPDRKLKDDWAKALAANYPKMSAELKQQIAGMPLYASTMRMAWPELSEEVKAQYRAQWAEELKTLLPAPAPDASPSKAGTSRGSESVARAMAEQDRRHQATMERSRMFMEYYKERFNINATWGASPYRYW